MISHLISVTPLDEMAGNNEPENFMNFQRSSLFENEVLECACYFFYIVLYQCHNKDTHFFRHTEFYSS